MKQILSKAGIYLNCIAAVLFSLATSNSNAQVTTISDYVMFSGNGGVGTTAPGSAGYGVIFGSSSTITGGIIGSNVLVQTTGGATLTSNIYSGGKVILANGNSVSGRVTAQNAAALSGNIFQTGSNAVISGVIDVNGNINIQSGTVTGPVHVTGPYPGPTPTTLPITNTPSFPVLPVFPPAAVFPAAGATNLTTTQTISPGSYGDIIFSNNKTLTLNGPGVYVFNSMNLSGNNNFIYNFQNLSVGVFKIYVHGNAFLGKFNASMINGGNATRILWEIHGSGVGSSSGSDAVTIANGSSGGSGSVKFNGTILAYNAGILIGSGTGSSQFTGTLLSRVRVMVQTGVTLTYSYFSECSTPVANAGTDVNFCGAGSAQIGSAPIAGNTYSWSPATGLNSSTVSNPTVTASSIGTTVYTVTVTVASTTCTASDQVSVTVNPFPVANAGTGVGFCGAVSAQIGSAPVAGNTYSLSPATGLSSSTVANPTVTKSTVGTTNYTVTVTATSTSCTATAQVAVTVNPLPAASAGTDVNFCGAGSTQIGSAPVAGNTYSSSPATGLSSSTVANPTVTKSTVGTTNYTVTVTTTSTSSTATDQVAVSVNLIPNVNMRPDVQHDCVTTSVNLSGSSTTPGASYSWTAGYPGNISAGANTATPTVNVF